MYARYPQLFTASSTAWQSLGSVPPVPSSPGSLWESYEDLGIELGEQGVVDDIARTSSSSCDLSRPSGDGAEKLKEGKMGVMTTTTTTNRQHVKGVAEKLTFVKAFGVKEKKKKTMTGKGKETQREVNNGITQDHASTQPGITITTQLSSMREVSAVEVEVEEEKKRESLLVKMFSKLNNMLMKLGCF